MGILDMSYSCRNSQSSPFLHKCLSQCLQTIVLSPRTWRKGQCAPLVQVPLRKNSHNAALFSVCIFVCRIRMIFISIWYNNYSIYLYTHYPSPQRAWAWIQAVCPEHLLSQIPCLPHSLQCPEAYCHLPACTPALAKRFSN